MFDLLSYLFESKVYFAFEISSNAYGQKIKYDYSAIFGKVCMFIYQRSNHSNCKFQLYFKMTVPFISRSL